MSDHENESYSEEEEITDLSNPTVVLKYKTAADIVNKALQGVLSQCTAGKQISDICAFGDLLIEKQCAEIFKNKDMEKGIAFPTCVSVNDVVCNYSPFPSDSKTLEAGDVVKVDMGLPYRWICRHGCEHRHHSFGEDGGGQKDGNRRCCQCA